MPSKVAARLRAVRGSAFAAALLWIGSPGMLFAADAEVSSVFGVGEFRLDTTAAWHEAQVAQQLYGGNFVRTGAYSRLGLLFRDRTQLRLNEKTILHIREVSDPAASTGNTRLRLERGRAWTRANLLPRGMEMETPAATAAIRGTDWDMEVAANGTATLTVLNGEVNFFNAFGAVTVASGEQARAVPGSAPVKLVLVQPADRVQWVTAYAIEPLRHIDIGAFPADTELAAGFEALAALEPDRADGHFDRVRIAGNASLTEVVALGRAAASIQREQLGPAVDRLEFLLAEPPAQPAAYLVLSDIDIFSGRLDRARQRLDAALKRFPDSDRVFAQLARVALVSGDANTSAELARRALAYDSTSLPAWLATGDAARIEGDAGTARDAYSRAIELQPGDDRGWYGLGVVNSEREEIRRGQRNLEKALELNPRGAGYRGAAATLDALAWRLEDAESGFAQALEQQPDDYIALTGLGVTQLKRGDIEGALDSLLRAEIMEPRYTRAHIYAAVAHYQAGRLGQATEELDRAREVDPLDPIPYLLASIVHTDLLQPAQAVAASREALVRMPNLKSLNQVANDSRGSANLGRAFAFWGLEEWARSYAHESWYPYWAGSHLFLADRYNGLFNKNSELFQGFLSDPLAFGASNRFNSLMTRPGNYFSGSMRYAESDDVEATAPFAQVNGLNYLGFPTSYFLGYSRNDLDFDTGPTDWESFTLGLGARVNHDVGFFLFYDANELDFELELDELIDTEQDLSTDRVDLGGHIRITPESQLWLKAGYFESDDEFDGSFLLQPIAIDEDIEQPDYAARLSLKFGERHNVSVGVEYVDRDTDSLGLIGIGVPGVLDAFSQFDEKFEEESLEVFLADRFEVSERLLLHAAVSYQDQDRENWQQDTLILPPFEDIVLPPTTTDRSRDGWYLRVGGVYRFAPERLVRLAYQDWLRPFAFATLGDVATAGIPLDDRLVVPGGELERVRGQLEWAFNADTFLTAWIDYKEIESNEFEFRPLDFISKREIESLQNLQQRDRGSLARDDMLEFVSIPVFESGDITEAGVTLNRILGDQWSVYGRYIYRDSENTGSTYRDNQLPYLPDDTFALGATWIRPDGWYFTSRLVYRSHRYTDEANTSPLESGWSGAFDLYWESVSKHWLLRLSVDDAFDDNLEPLYTVELNFRI